MRTTINIPDDIIDQLVSLTKADSKTEAVNRAIIDWVKLQKIKKLKLLRGKLKIRNNIEKLRSKEIEEINDVGK